MLDKSDLMEVNIQECLFCKITHGIIPCMKIYEDKYTLAFMDIAEDVDGHILVVPKTHKKNILDCDEETLINLMKSVKRVSIIWLIIAVIVALIYLMQAMKVQDNQFRIFIFTLFQEE